MKRTLILAASALVVVAGPFATAPVSAQSNREIANDRADLERQQRQLDAARAYGSNGDIYRERDDVRDARRELNDDRHDRDRNRNRNDRRYSAYDHNRPDPRYGNYRADRYYREGNYAPHQLASNDRVYRGGDGRYYCRRNDGTTGLIVGALGGGVLGNAIAPGGSKTLGALLGGGLGAVVGQGIDRGGTTCR